MVTIETRNVDGVTIVNVAGQITFGDAASVRQTLCDLLAQNCNLLLNLGEVSFIDQTGIGALIYSYTRALFIGRDIKLLLKVSTSVYKTLDSTQLINMFEVFEDERSGVKSFH